jgi:hypothetical protein
MPGPVAPAFRATLKLLNKKNTFRKIWREQEIIAIFAPQNNNHALHAHTYRIAKTV